MQLEKYAKLQEKNIKLKVHFQKLRQHGKISRLKWNHIKKLTKLERQMRSTPFLKNI